MLQVINPHSLGSPNPILVSPSHLSSTSDHSPSLPLSSLDISSSAHIPPSPSHLGGPQPSTQESHASRENQCPAYIYITFLGEHIIFNIHLVSKLLFPPY